MASLVSAVVLLSVLVAAASAPDGPAAVPAPPDPVEPPASSEPDPPAGKPPGEGDPDEGAEAVVLDPPVADAPEGTPSTVDPDTIQAWLSSVVLLVTGPAYCSGVVIDDAGTIATAYHCIANGNRPEVHLRDGTKAVGRVVAAVPRDDLALVSVPDLALMAPALEIHPGAPRQGEAVWGLGHPYAPAAERTAAMSGMLLWSVTEGIVSAVGPRLVQTDAALNPGNSGGPVVDARGRIVGIASRKLAGDNVAFLASAERLRAILESRKKPMVLGGQLELGVSLLQGTSVAAASSYMVTAQAVLRDRAVVGLSGALSDSARGVAFERGVGESVLLEGSLAGRLRLGRGGWSTAIDVGGTGMLSSGYTTEFFAETSTWSVQPTAMRLRPGAFARVSAAGIGIRWAMVPDLSAPDPWAVPELFIALDLMVPGTVVTF